MLLDAFGWAFVQRHADHPFLQRLEIEPVASQFPSTTTAHLTTLYTGLPVAQHGLYEWLIYEPALDGIVLPLPFVGRDGPLDLDPRVLVPGPDVLRAARRACARPAARGDLPTQYNRAAFAGATVDPYERFEDARRAARRPARADPPLLGPDRRHRTPLRPVEREVRDRVGEGAGRADRAPRHVRRRHRRPRADRRRRDRLPGRDGRRCSSTCATRPPGSARDCFLHVSDPETVVGELAARWASGPRSASRPSSSPTPARACGPAWPTSACSPRPAAWRGWQAYPSRQLRSRATTAGSRRRSRRPGSASCRHELRRQLHRARARLGGALRLAPPRARRHDLRDQPDHPAPRPARPHPPPHHPGRGLHRPGRHAHARLRGRGQGARARARSPASRPTCAATSPTGTPRTCC